MLAVYLRCWSNLTFISYWLSGYYTRVIITFLCWTRFCWLLLLYLLFPLKSRLLMKSPMSRDHRIMTSSPVKLLGSVVIISRGNVLLPHVAGPICPLIGAILSRDYNTALWLAGTSHVVVVLASHWTRQPVTIWLLQIFLWFSRSISGR